MSKLLNADDDDDAEGAENEGAMTILEVFFEKTFYRILSYTASILTHPVFLAIR